MALYFKFWKITTNNQSVNKEFKERGSSRIIKFIFSFKQERDKGDVNLILEDQFLIQDLIYHSKSSKVRQVTKNSMEKETDIHIKQ